MVVDLLDMPAFDGRGGDSADGWYAPFFSASWSCYTGGKLAEREGPRESKLE